MGVNDINSLAHSKWNCKYHIVFAPKYRRMVFYGQKKHEVGKILRKLYEWKGVEVLSSTMLYEQFGELKYKYRNREFWCKGYYVDTVGKNEARISEYISKQLEEDKMGDQLTMSEAGAFRKKKK